MTALALAAVSGTRGKAGVALAADCLLAVVLRGKSLKGGLDNRGTTTETKNQVDCRLLLNVVVGKGATIIKLLTSENQALLVRRNALLVADFALHSLDGVTRLHLKGNSLTRQGFNEDLHRTGRKV